MTRVAILGSTGSIGTSALDVLRQLGAGFELVGLAANTQWHVLADQIAEFRPQRAVLASAELFPRLAERVALDGGRPSVSDGRRPSVSDGRHPSGANCVALACGADAVADLAADADVDVVLNAIVGAAGLRPALAALRAGKTLALANKECMVMAGELLNRVADESGARIIPVDSEHSAVFQAMQAGRASEVRTVWITASGGPFRTLPADQLDAVTPEHALRHPNWAMGPKITVDSATMMNKALEVIEAKWLFRLGVSQIRVLIHPQSIVHSLVEFCDGSTIAQLGVPDMRVPIQYALTYPERRPGPVAAANLAQVGRLDFAEPDLERFPALGLGYRAVEAGGTMGAVLNAANEVAVRAFLDGRLAFPRIARLVAGVMDRHHVVHPVTAEAIDDADRWARQEAESWIACS